MKRVLAVAAILFVATLLFAQVTDNNVRIWTNDHTFTDSATFDSVSTFTGNATFNGTATFNGQMVTDGGEDFGAWSLATGTLTTGQVLALNGTPVEVIAAPGAGNVILIESVLWQLDFNATGYVAGAGEDLVLEYQTSNSNAVEACDASTNCLDAATVVDAWGYAKGKSLGAGVYPNQAIDATIEVGEWITGDSPIHYRIRYRIISSDLSS